MRFAGSLISRVRNYYILRHARRFEESFRLAKSSSQYVAYIDLLGFGSRIRRDFRETVETYKYILTEAVILGGHLREVQVRIYSDAFLITASELGPILFAANQLHMSALRNGHLIRGGISFGEHLEAEYQSNLVVVSAPLVTAVEIEKKAVHPCVIVDPKIKIPDDHWGPPEMPNLFRRVLYFEDKVIVNPCCQLWGTSARVRVEGMLADMPQFAEKYRWFIRLHEAIFSERPLIP